MSEFDDSFRDSISTVDQDGKRNWVFAKKYLVSGLKERVVCLFFINIVICWSIY